MKIRRAERADIPALLRLERLFPGDRLTRTSFQRFIESATTDVLVAETKGAKGQRALVGNAIVSYRRGFHAARLYSLVTAPEVRGKGVGKALMKAAEAAARERGAVAMRLEVRVDNAAAIRFYRAGGYETVGLTADFYEDHSDALRMRKRLRDDHAHLLSVPYHPQSLGFTCGPASLMMALRALGHATPLGTAHELALWREATTVFMLAGHGGTSAYGLAVAALRRGFAVEVWVDAPGVPFVDTVRAKDKKRIVQIAHDTFTSEMKLLGGRVRVGDFSANDVVATMQAGAVPLLLVSGARLYHARIPHWVVATGWDDDHIYVHDPLIPEGSTRADAVHQPLRRSEFAQIARYGRARHRAMVVVARQPGRWSRAAGPSAR